MTDLTLYTHPQSRGRIAHWIMEELGEPYETVWLDYGTSMKAPDYLAVNPMVSASSNPVRLPGSKLLMPRAWLGNYQH